MTRRNKKPGKFWPAVREQIWRKAEELYMLEHPEACLHGLRPERSELRESGYFYRAKVLVLRELQNK
jgi:5,10-methenyltetrahydromethanopterin hydrogenase